MSDAGGIRAALRAGVGSASLLLLVLLASAPTPPPIAVPVLALGPAAEALVAAEPGPGPDGAEAGVPLVFLLGGSGLDPLAVVPPPGARFAETSALARAPGRAAEGPPSPPPRPRRH